MSDMTLKTYLLIEDLLPLSEALSFTEKEGLTLVKYKDVMEGSWLDKRKKESGKPSSKEKTSRNWVVWRCPVKSENDNLKPAGLTPREGCGHYNIMSTKHGEDKIKNGIFQTSPCEKCEKRTRQNGLLKFFSSIHQAITYTSSKNKELEV
tara:strand:- start:410 stop:859 length:450 start_codon:yes stop_codon:yes gene_type:complete